MPLPEQLLLSDLLARRVRCDRGLDHGLGQLGWMHPPVHRLLGWATRPSALSQRRCIWRLDQLRALGDAEALVQGDAAETDPSTLERLPTLLGAVLLSGSNEPLARVVDAAFEPGTGRIRHYLVARSDPRLPGSSRWRLSPERIVDQRPGEVSSALHGLADLPLAQASLRESLLRRSRRWRDQWDVEASRFRDQWQQASGRFEQRLEGWLEEPPWEEPQRPRPASRWPDDEDIWPEEGWEQQRHQPHSAAAADEDEDPSLWSESSAAEDRSWADPEGDRRAREPAVGADRPEDDFLDPAVRRHRRRTDPLDDLWDDP